MLREHLICVRHRVWALGKPSHLFYYPVDRTASGGHTGHGGVYSRERGGAK